MFFHYVYAGSQWARVTVIERHQRKHPSGGLYDYPFSLAFLLVPITDILINTPQSLNAFLAGTGANTFTSALHRDWQTLLTCSSESPSCVFYFNRLFYVWLGTKHLLMLLVLFSQSPTHADRRVKDCRLIPMTNSWSSHFFSLAHPLQGVLWGIHSPSERLNRVNLPISKLEGSLIQLEFI